MTRLILTLICNAFVCIAQADETWRFDAGLDYVHANRDSTSTKSSYAVVGATAYAAPMPLEGDYPYAEAQFVERSASLSLRYDQGRHTEDANTDATDLHAYGVEGVFMHPSLDVYGEVGLHRIRYKPANFYQLGSVVHTTESDITETHLELGYFLARRLLVSAEYAETKFRTQHSTPSTIRYNLYRTEIAARYLSARSGDSWFSVGGEVARTYYDQTHGYVASIEGTYYFTRSQSLTLGVSHSDAKSYTGRGLDTALSYRLFLTPRVSAVATFERFDPANAGSSENVDLWRLGVEARF